MSISKAAADGSEVEALKAMRDHLAVAMDDAPPTVVAQIAARLQAVLARISELEPAGEVTLSDALAERRAKRTGKPARDAG